MITDHIIGWFLDAFDYLIGLIPDWTPSLPSMTWLLNPLAQINWLIGIDLLFATMLTVLALGPAMMLTRVALWFVGLFTPGGTKN